MTLPTIPDSFYKILALSGLAIILYSIFDFDKARERYLLKQSQRDSTSNLYNAKIDRVNYDRKKLKIKAEILSARYAIENPVRDQDSIIVFDIPKYKDEKSYKISDSLHNLFEGFKDANFELQNLQNQVQQNEELSIYDNEIYQNDRQKRNFFIVIGILVLLIGIIGIYKQQQLNDKLLEIQVAEKVGFFNSCQSCGKLFKLLRPKGTDSKGHLIDGFCLECYKDGQYTNPDLSKEELLKSIYKEQKINSFFQKWLLKRKIENLERWNKRIYF